MSCKYCKHRSDAYKHVKDEHNHDLYIRQAEIIPFDDGSLKDCDPMIAWCVGPEVIDWAEHRPRLLITTYDQDGDEGGVSIPINYCPMCGEELPRAEVDA